MASDYINTQTLPPLLPLRRPTKDLKFLRPDGREQSPPSFPPQLFSRSLGREQQYWAPGRLQTSFSSKATSYSMVFVVGEGGFSFPFFFFFLKKLKYIYFCSILEREMGGPGGGEGQHCVLWWTHHVLYNMYITSQIGQVVGEEGGGFLYQPMYVVRALPSYNCIFRQLFFLPFFILFSLGGSGGRGASGVLNSFTKK